MCESLDKTVFTSCCHITHQMFILYLYFFVPQALAKFQTSHKVTTMTGIEQEESLISESAMMETSLNSQILDLENESKQVNHQKSHATFKCVYSLLYY